LLLCWVDANKKVRILIIFSEEVSQLQAPKSTNLDDTTDEDEVFIN